MNILLDLLSPINIIFLIIITYLTFEDFRSFKSGSYRNYKTIIISVGILGTFTGIFWGLLHFDSKDLMSIQTSIPNLLNGLRTAFITSIAGMVSALTLTFAQKKFFDASYSEDSSEILRSIEIKLSKLDNLGNIYDVGLDLLKEVNSMKDDIYTANNQMIETLSENFEKTNKTLEQAIDKLSEDSTKEIIASLEDVISSFNSSMTDQFGQNFKEFNTAVGRLLEWQENYKDSITQMENNLAKAVESIEKTDDSLQSIASKNEEIVKIYELFGEMTNKFEEQAYQINTKILSQVELLEVMQGVFNDTKIKFNRFVQEFSAGSNKVVDGFSETKESMDSLSNTIKTSLNQQSEALNQLSKKLELELPRSLFQLDKSLNALTEGFKNDYKTFLEYYKQIVLSQE